MFVFIPPSGYFESRNVPKLQHVPIVLSSDGSYPVEANRYLDERCLGEWKSSRSQTNLCDPPILTLKSRLNTAGRLVSFLRWIESQKSLDLSSVNYEEHVLYGYQIGLLDGSASASGKALKPSTVNLYVNEACLFLEWAVDRGISTSFRVRQNASKYFTVGRRGRPASRTFPSSRREGRLVQAVGRVATLATREEVRDWLAKVYLRSLSKGLVFELICRAGLRLSEATQLRLSCLPSEMTKLDEDVWPESWRRAGCVPVVICYGVKGPKVLPQSLQSC